MGYLIGAVIAFIVAILALFVIGWLSINILVVADKLFGAWTIFPPALSWTIVGFFIGTLVYFAIRESKKLSLPGIQPIVIVCTCLLVIMTPIVGPYSKHFVSPTITNSTIMIPATQPWTDTGIYIKAGQWIKIKASGSVTAISNKDRVWKRVGKMVGPNGGEYNSAFAKNRINLHAEGMPFMSLIGKIGSKGKPFLIGKTYEGEVVQSGDVFLGINGVNNIGGRVENSWWSDNQGSFTAEITTSLDSHEKVKSSSSASVDKSINVSPTKPKMDSGSGIRNSESQTRNTSEARSVSIVEEERSLTDRATEPQRSNNTSIKEQQTNESTPDVGSNQLAKITIRSVPILAAVFIDKKHIGETPLTINMDVGPHGIQLQKNGYQDKFDVIRVTKNGQNVFVYELEQ